MAAPMVMIANFSTNISSQDLIKAIRKDDELPNQEESLDPNICGYLWHIDNKYYFADVILCHLKEETNTSFIPHEIEAIVSVIDDQTISFDKAKKYWKELEDLDPATRIIVCHGFTKAGGVRRREVIEWCIDNSFELVELNKSEFDEDEEEEDEFQEPYGSNRINQALHAHNWPNLEMKDRDEREIARQLQIKLGLQDDPEEDGPSPEEAGYQRLPDSEAAADDALVECEMTSNKNSAAGLDKGGGANDETSSKTKDDNTLDEDMALFQALGNEDPGGESLKNFYQMASMKGMSIRKRRTFHLKKEKKYAEKVVVNFWKAIGGAEDEIEGLSDED
ncbi:putative alpha- and gamma-adaptin-binding protein p34-like [Apostichopus japonicus]|uniref:Putative alpha-and gamma-adaptin-binding protein p34-like n=1 Tax=Stichopus japonicus TaxID=307972 RepID=A0A2G8LPM4_STIJA|nr:putative alpha- and gamma-adaptin-binding protein p34-like [Apostichopus japonicus]